MQRSSFVAAVAPSAEEVAANVHLNADGMASALPERPSGVYDSTTSTIATESSDAVVVTIDKNSTEQASSFIAMLPMEPLNRQRSSLATGSPRASRVRRCSSRSRNVSTFPTSQTLFQTSNLFSFGACDSSKSSSKKPQDSSSEMSSSWFRGFCRRQCKLADGLELLVLVQQLYYTLSIPFRMGLYFDPFCTNHREWTRELTVLTTFDALADTFGLLMYLREVMAGERRHPSKNASNRMVQQRHGEEEATEKSYHKLPTSNSWPSAVFSKFLLIGRKHKSRGSSNFTSLSAWIRLTSVLPIELVFGVLGYEFIHVARVTKLLQTPILYRLGRKWIHKLLKHPLMRVFRGCLTLLMVQLVLGGLVFVHWQACGYLLISHLECGLSLDKCSNEGDCWQLHDQLRDATVARKYARAMYWSSRTLITLGFPDATATTNIETVYTILAEFAGAFWCAAVISLFGYMFASVSNPDQTQDIFMYKVHQYLKFIDAPADLQQRIHSFLVYQWQSTGEYDEARLLRKLPDHLQNCVIGELRTTFLLQTSCFADQSIGFCNALAMALVPSTFAPLDWLLVSGFQQEMFIVTAGSVMIVEGSSCNPQVGGQTLEIQTRGHAFGAICLFESGVFQEKVFAETFCEALSLSSEALTKTLDAYYQPQIVFEMTRLMHAAARQEYCEFRSKHSNARSSKYNKTAIDVHEDEPHRQLPPPSSSSSSSSSASAMEAAAWETHKTLLESRPWQHPRSLVRRIWRLMRCLGVMYLALEIPFVVVFYYGNKNGNFHDWNFLVIFAVSLLWEIFFYVDFYLRSFHFLVEEQPGVLIFANQQTRTSILQDYQQNGFYWDLIANLPLALVYDLIDGVYDFPDRLAWLSLLRLVRFIRVRRINTLVRATLHEFAGAIQFIVYCLLSIFVYCHFMGCVWYIMGFYTLEQPFQRLEWNEISHADCLVHAKLYSNCTWHLRDGLEMEGTSPRSTYIRSLYFAISTFSTVAYGDIVPYTTGETWVCSIQTYVGGILCYAVVGGMGSAISRLVDSRRTRNRHAQHVNQFFADHQISLSLQREIHQFHRFAHQTRVYNTERELLQRLSRGLRHDLNAFIHRQMVQSLSALLELQDPPSDHACALAIASRMARCIHDKAEILVHEGELAGQLFVVNSGLLEVVDLSAKVCWQFLSDGSIYSETLFLGQLHHEFCVRTAQASEVSILARSDLEEVLVMFPTQRVKLQVLAKNLVVRHARDQQNILENLKKLKVHMMFEDCESFCLTHSQTNSCSAAMVAQCLSSSGRGLDEKPGQEPGKHGSRLTNPTWRKTRVFSNAIPVEILIKERRWRGFRVAWELLIALIVLYNSVSVLFRNVFDPEPSRQVMIALTACDYVLDLLLLVDIYLKWTHFPPKTDVVGKLPPQEIRRVYKQQGWFYWDLLNSLPCYYIGKNLKLMTRCRLPRLVRACQLRDSAEIIQNFLVQQLSGSLSYSMIALGRVLLLFFLCCHFFGSIFYAISHGEANPKRNWIYLDLVTSLDLNNMWIGYLRSFYWAMSSFTVVNYGDMVANTYRESVWACVVCLFGTFFMSNVGGEMVSIFNNMEEDKDQYLAKVEAFNRFARHYHIPSVIRKKAYKLLHFEYTSQRGPNAQELFSDLTPGLHMELFGQLYLPLVQTIGLFHGLDKDQKKQLCSMLQTRIYIPNDLIILEKSAGESLFILHKGRAQVFRQQTGVVLCELGDGQLFGEASFFQSQIRRLASVRAVSFCEVLHLEKTQWQAFASRARNRAASALVLKATEQEVVRYKRILEQIDANLTRNAASSLTASIGAFSVDDDPRQSSTLRDGSKVDEQASSNPTNGNQPAGFVQEITMTIHATSGVHQHQLEHQVNIPSSSSTVSQGNAQRSASRSMLGSNLAVQTDTATIEDKDLVVCDQRAADLATSRGSSMYAIGVVGSETVTNLFAKEDTSKMEADTCRLVLFHESSRFRFGWEMLKLLLVIYYLVALPLRVAFFDDILLASGGSRVALIRWTGVEYLVDGFFLVDIYLRMHHFPHVTRGQVITDRQVFRKRYLHSSEFFYDALSCCPVEVLACVPILSNGDNRLRLVAILRLEILFRAFQLEMLWRRCELYIFAEQKVPIRGNLVLYGKILLIAVLSSHWIGCLWFLVGRSFRNKYHHSWLKTAFELVPEADAPMANVTLLTKYLRAYHYAIGSMSTVTYGDIATTNYPETVAQIWIILLCIAFYGFITGKAQQIHEANCQLALQHETFLRLVFRFGSHRGISQALASQICKHLHDVAQQKGHTSAKVAIRELSLPLQQEIYLFLHRRLLQGETMTISGGKRGGGGGGDGGQGLFDGFPVVLVQMICRALKIQLYANHEIIYEQHEWGQTMFFIAKGLVLLKNHKTHHESIKKPAQSFGEKNVFQRIARQETALALAKCQLAVLHAEKYQAIVALFPEHRWMMETAWRSGDPCDGAQEMVVSP